MKVAELFVELGFAVKGEDKLKGFEASLISAAAAAKSLVAELTTLAGLKPPQQVAAAPTAAQQVAAAPTTAQPVAAPSGVLPPILAPQTAIPPSTAASPGAAINQSLKSFGVFAKQLLGLGSLAVILRQLGSALVDMTKSTIKTSFATDKFGKATGLSREELLKWQYAAGKSDVSPESIRDNLSNLAQRAFEMRYLGQHQEAASLLTGWGLDMQLSPDKLLEQFGKRFANSSLNEALMIAKVAGISPDVAYMMHANKGVIPTRPPGEALSAEQQLAVMKAGTALNNLGTSISALKDKAIAELAVNFMDLGKGLSLVSSFFLGDGGRLLSATLLALSAFNAQAVATPALPAQRNSGQPSATTYNVTNNNQIDGARDPNMVAREISEASYQAPKNTGP
jgi:hypothetical protein